MPIQRWSRCKSPWTKLWPLQRRQSKLPMYFQSKLHNTTLDWEYSHLPLTNIVRFNYKLKPSYDLQQNRMKPKKRHMVSLSGLSFLHAANTFYFLFLRSFDGQGWKTAFRSLSTEAELKKSGSLPTLIYLTCLSRWLWKVIILIKQKSKEILDIA